MKNSPPHGERVKNSASDEFPFKDYRRPMSVARVLLSIAGFQDLSGFRGSVACKYRQLGGQLERLRSVIAVSGSSEA